jgi:hypothetical protein
MKAREWILICLIAYTAGLLHISESYSRSEAQFYYEMMTDHGIASMSIGIIVLFVNLILVKTIE